MNTQKRDIILAGFFSEIIELCEENDYNIIGIIDKFPIKSDYPYLGNDDAILSHPETYRHAEIVIVPDNPHLKQKLAHNYLSSGFSFTSLISKKSVISPSCRIGDGCVIQSLSNISSNSIIGSFVKINTLANIMHDCVIGDFCIIAPNAVLLGNVNIGDRVFVGANATILPNISVASDTIIGAGAVVTKNITEPGYKYAGVPAVILKNK